VACWGSSDYFTDAPSMSNVGSIYAGMVSTCTTGRDDGKVTCFSKDDTHIPANLDGVITSASLGLAHSCLLVASGTVRCYGGDPFGQVSGASSKTCGLAVAVGAWVLLFRDRWSPRNMMHS